tara:strand:- start:133 stop:414 length:282 start_codon:yes stop_codon:yes gene_type:complete
MIVEIILSVLMLVFGYTTFNLFRKLERMENVLERYESWINNFSNSINSANNRLDEIDNKGTFESDDEVGFFFKYIKDIQSQLTTITDELTGEK